MTYHLGKGPWSIISLSNETLIIHDLLDKPANIYNEDESGVPFNPRPPKIVSQIERETKKV